MTCSRSHAYSWQQGASATHRTWRTNSRPGEEKRFDTSKINWWWAEAILTLMVMYVTMVYGPIAAFLVEMFPTKIRYTSMSLPYHIGNGWVGGILPLFATALVAAYGNIYAGLWYPIVVAIMTFVFGSLMLVETNDVDIVGAMVARTRGMTGEERFVIFPSSLGTAFEWYDFYLYAILAPFFASLFFPAGILGAKDRESKQT
jgi:hypothetical protein